MRDREQRIVGYRLAVPGHVFSDRADAGQAAGTSRSCVGRFERR